MTYALRRIEAHMNSECDPELCRLCFEENAADDGMSDHQVWPIGDDRQPETCDCEAGSDHDAGDEVTA